MDVLTNQPSLHENRWLRWTRLWGPVIGYCACIFFFSTQQDLTQPEFPSSDKVAHFLEYGVLGILWARAAKEKWPHWTPLLLVMSTCVFTGLYGVSDEWHQSYVPGRFSDWHDMLADVIGGTLGGASYFLLLYFLNRRESRVASSRYSIVSMAENDE